MCARITQALEPGSIGRALGLDDPGSREGAIWNGTPSGFYWICRVVNGTRRLARVRWGLTPRWSRDPTVRWANARSETVWRKPSFREAAERRRAVLPVNGWFEWRGEQGRRQPYYVSAADEAPLLLAAIWEPPGAASKDESFAVLTTEPRTELRELHDRQPSILEAPGIEQWLDPNVGATAAATAGRDTGRLALRIRRISRRMNSAQANEPGILEEVGGE